MSDYYRIKSWILEPEEGVEIKIRRSSKDFCSYVEDELCVTDLYRAFKEEFAHDLLDAIERRGQTGRSPGDIIEGALKELADIKE